MNSCLVKPALYLVQVNIELSSPLFSVLCLCLPCHHHCSMFFVYVYLVITIVLCSLSMFALSSPLLHPMFQRTSPRVRLAEVMAEPKKENESPKGEDWWKNMHLTDFWSFWPKWGWVKNPTLRWLTDDHWSLNRKGDNHNHVRIIDRKSLWCLKSRCFPHHPNFD